jgi:hypothetical protein
MSSKKKLLVIFYFNGVLCNIVYPDKGHILEGYIWIQSGNFKGYVLPQTRLRVLEQGDSGCICHDMDVYA